jgi:uncharacterized hydrophobic protein (TIGR00271 family)
MSTSANTPNPQPSSPRSPREIIYELWAAVRQWFHDLLDLQEGLDREGTIVAIRNNKRMQGANAWLLGCSIMIASLGLDLNSPAVIIGAMLVSPLMSPILGIGLGVAINDKDAMFTAIRHFGIAIVIALVTSVLYFFVTPFGNMTPEIQGRTSPTFLDGLVAIFGGFAGIISSTRKDKTNAIPGVAIATALMPPLCVTGFGIAEFFEILLDSSLQGAERGAALNRAAGIVGGSFYLFFLNSFFIALTTYIIIRLLRFPLKSYMNAREARRNRIITALFSLLVTLPSAFILYNLYLLQQDKQEVSAFVEDYFPQACINYELTSIDTDTNKLILQLLGQRIPEDSITHYEDLLAQDYHLNKPVKLFPMQAEMSMEDIKTLLQEQRREVVGMLETERRRAEEARLQQEAIQLEQARAGSDSVKVEKTLRIARTVFKQEIEQIQYAPLARSYGDSSMMEQSHLFLVDWANRRGTSANKERLEGILRVGTDFDTLTVVSYY